MGIQGMLPTGAALLALVMALVLLTIVVVAILIPGAMSLARHWRERKGPELLVGLGCALTIGHLSMMISVLASTTLSPLARVALPALAIIITVIWLIVLNAYWRPSGMLVSRIVVIAMIIAWPIYLFFTALYVGALFANAPT